MKNLLFGTLMAMIGLPSIAFADTTVECHYCSSSQKATSAMQATGQTEYVFVMDFGRSEVVKYFVLVEYDAEVGSVTKTATPVSLSSKEQSAWADVEDLYAKMEALFPYGSDYGSAYDVYNNSNAWNLIMSDYRSDNYLGYPVSVFVGSIALVSNRLAQLNPQLRVVFQDGSFIVFNLNDLYFDSSSGQLAFNLQPAYGEDADGNVIHSSGGGYIGDTGHSSDSTRIANYWGLLGVDWSREGGTRECTWNCTADRCRLNCSRP